MKFNSAVEILLSLLYIIIVIIVYYYSLCYCHATFVHSDGWL